MPDAQATLLDVGAGAGHLAEFMAVDRPCVRYAFIEPLASLRQRLCARHGETADFADREAFDGIGYVALLDVLEHQADDAGFLEQLFVRMQRGARLIITVPALPVLWSAWDEGLGHHRRYVKATLRSALTDAGFAVEELCYLFPELLPSALYRRFASTVRKESSTANDLEFPHPPAAVNEALYALGRLSQRFRRFHLAGTSLFAVAIKK